MNDSDQPMDVLVIDDEEGMREGIRRILTKQGFHVDMAPDGESALELLKKHAYDLAFVDLKMPGIDGFQVTEFINERYRNKTVVVIVSALATVEAAVEVTRHGAFDFLVKPFTPSDLLAVLERAVEQRSLLIDREKYLSELNNERNYSRQLINSIQEGVVVLNIRSEPVLMNPKAEFLLEKKFGGGLTLDELFTDDKVKEAVRQVLASPVETTDPAKLGVSRVLQYSHDQTMLQVRISPLIRDSEPGGAIVLVSDITEAWQAEQDKNRFVSMVAHELKSPLAAIINYINVIQTGMFDQNAEKIHELLARCIIRGEALLELIQDLLYINKRQAGKVSKSIELLDLGDVVQQQLDFYHGQAEKREISLQFDRPAEPCRVRADRGDLDRIFMNLISNGLKYNRDGGRLSVSMKREQDEIVIDVQDTGIGMTPKEMEHLFEEFYRVRSSKTGGITGTGLGLATVKRVLNEYNARISVDSVPDQGSTFTVRFPAAQEG
jgi:signal transduction histidine kinase/DNA-binding response OmpR family regulator